MSLLSTTANVFFGLPRERPPYKALETFIISEINELFLLELFQTRLGGRLRLRRQRPPESYAFLCRYK